ncbi:MAG: hypothetical protein IJP17_04285, partial [Clostridia bacterium]|nr:hypothetical protein [Clostridia bacterium]
METIFIELLNMSISSCWLILAVILLRLLLRRAPRNILCILWAFVGVRLLLPFAPESIFSLVPSAEAVPDGILLSQTPGISTGIDPIDHSLNPIISDAFAPEAGASVNPLQVVAFAASILWMLGVLAMLAYGAISYIRLRRRVAASINLRGDTWLCDDIDSPFIAGIIRPRIFVPSDVDNAQLAYIEAHERAHIERRDQLWKFLAFVILSIHWFNPAVWAAYILFCRDVEFACDERVIKNLELSERKEYSRALLSCSMPHHSAAVCPPAFGEVGVKRRIESVLSYKKPASWLITAAVIACVVVALCFLTNPTTSIDGEAEAYLHAVILEEGRSEHTDGHFACEAHDILGTERRGDKLIIYALVMYNEYSFDGGVLVNETGWHIPSVITLDMGGSGYSYDYQIPGDGTKYVPDIRELFPWYLERKA